MHDNQSLLGQFFNRIKGSQEDIATEGLNYILNRSAAARKALLTIIENQTRLQLPELIFQTQVIGEYLERPDIVGRTGDGGEILIIESKFWSSLTANQPTTYINRFKKTESILLFICPSLRVISLWQEILDRLPNDYLNSNKNYHCFNNSQHIILKSWSDVLITIREYLVQKNEYLLISDVDQIIGLCNVIDQNTFLPLTDDDLSPAVPRRISSYYDLVDKVLDEIKVDLPIELSGLKATAQRTGYIRYFRYQNLGLSLHLNYRLWKDELDTPFWLGFQRVSSPAWSIDEEIQNRVHLSGKRFYYNSSRVPHYPLKPLTNSVEESVVKKLASDAIDIIKYMAL